MDCFVDGMEIRLVNVWPLNFLLLAISLSSLFGFARSTPEGDFWKWFQNNEAALFDFEKNQDRIFGQLAAELHKIDANLTFEFSSIENGRREFIISADGIREAFPKVEKLYAAAPNLPRWKIIKFRPRREPSTISYNGTKVDVDAVRIEVRPHGQKIDVTVFLPGYTKDTESTFGSIAFLFLDQALGEYDVETRVGVVDVKSIADASAKAISVQALPKVFDSLVVN
jgi:hypothetical protein